jgi:hypothetical protein
MAFNTFGCMLSGPVYQEQQPQALWSRRRLQTHNRSLESEELSITLSF